MRNPPWYHWYYTRPPDPRVSIIQYFPRSLCICHHGGSIRPDLWVYCSLREGLQARGGASVSSVFSRYSSASYPRRSLCFHDCNSLRLRNFRHRLWVCGHCRFILPQVCTKGLNIFSVFSVAATVKRDCNEPFDRSRSLFEEKKRGSTHVPRRHDA